MSANKIIVIGPQRSGKTINQDAIRQAYKCQAAYDAGDPRIKSATGRIVVLAVDHPQDPYDRRYKMDGTVVTIEEAKVMCGERWVEPVALPKMSAKSED
jgi:hypothetical protein